MTAPVKVAVELGEGRDATGRGPVGGATKRIKHGDKTG
jgi:hypothetical protein